MALQGNFSVPKRYITSHNSDGEAIIDTSVPEEVPFYTRPSKAVSFASCYVTRESPVQLNQEADLKAYQDLLSSPPGLAVSTGTVLRYVDMSPGSASPMHRTLSLDYGVVLEGEVEVILDSGETRLLKRGDICVQRGIMHAWRNTSEKDWARILYVLQPSLPITVEGKELGEDYGTIQGVKTSK